jgi:hypothetical protein
MEPWVFSIFQACMSGCQSVTWKHFRQAKPLVASHSDDLIQRSRRSTFFKTIHKSVVSWKISTWEMCVGSSSGASIGLIPSRRNQGWLTLAVSARHFVHGVHREWALWSPDFVRMDWSRLCIPSTRRLLSAAKLLFRNCRGHHTQINANYCLTMKQLTRSVVYLLVVQLVFRFNHFQGKMHFQNFSQKVFVL